MLHLTKEVNVDSVDYTLVVTTKVELETSPITIYLNQLNNLQMGEYIYAISSYATQLNSIDNTNLTVTSLIQLLNKRFQKPIYLNVNGVLRDSAVVELFREIIDLVGTKSTLKSS